MTLAGMKMMDLYDLRQREKLKLARWKTEDSMPTAEDVYSGVANGMNFKETHKSAPLRKKNQL